MVGWVGEIRRSTAYGSLFYVNSATGPYSTANGYKEPMVSMNSGIGLHKLAFRYSLGNKYEGSILNGQEGSCLDDSQCLGVGE